MWQHVAGRSDIVGITNCIHTPTWVDSRITEAYDQEEPLLPVHNTIKRELIEFIEDRTGAQLRADRILIGFSRRAATYKRSDLIFSDMDTIEPYLDSGELQLVFSGGPGFLDVHVHRRRCG